MMLSADEIAAQDFGLPRFSELYTHYCAALREARQMDYDDQMAYALAILRKQPEILAEYNYRSTPEILRLAGAFIEGNRDRYPKTIRATRAKGCRVRLAHAASRQAQYRYLLALAGERRAPFAVLYRNNDSALPLIDALERAGLPYRCRSFDDTFFTHRIVCDVQDILRTRPFWTVCLRRPGFRTRAANASGA